MTENNDNTFEVTSHHQPATTGSNAIYNKIIDPIQAI